MGGSDERRDITFTSSTVEAVRESQKESGEQSSDKKGKENPALRVGILPEQGLLKEAVELAQQIAARENGKRLGN
ncbi:hypothetical protein ACFB49_22860 [Sphingomonas sp. DBB INV C78]